MTLKDWLAKQPPGAASDLAKRAGTTRQTISHLRTKGHVPSVTLAMRIAVATGGAVTVADWQARKR